MSQPDAERRCPVCDRPVPRGTTCPYCRGHVGRSRNLHRGAWMMVAGAAVFLAALFVWVNRLEGEPEKNPAAKHGSARLVPDGEVKPGEPVGVPFGSETCVPWHVSGAVEPPPEDANYLVLTSRVVDPSGLVLSGFSAVCGEHPTLILEDLQPGKLSDIVAGCSPDGIVVVGMAAFKRAKREAAGTPVFFARISNPVQAGLDKPGTAGVSPWIPAAPFVRHMLTILPAEGTIGVIHAAGPLANMARHTAELLAEKKRRVSRYEISPDNAEQVLARAAGECKAWIVFTDRDALDERLFNRIQVAAEKSAIPVGVTDEDHVRLGALAGVGPDNFRIGRQLCHLAGARIRDKLPQGSHVFCPEYSYGVIHIAVAEKLGYMFDPVKVTQVKTYQWH